MISKTTNWGKSTITVFNPSEPLKPIVICALATYPDMMNAMDEYLEKINVLIANEEEVKTNDTIKYQLDWIVDHYSNDIEVPLVMVFDDLAQYINEGEFPAEIFDELSDLDRPTKSCEMILDIGRRFLLYDYGYYTNEEMHKWVDSLFGEGTPELVYCEK